MSVEFLPRVLWCHRSHLVSVVLASLLTDMGTAVRVHRAALRGLGVVAERSCQRLAEQNGAVLLVVRMSRFGCTV